MTSLFSDSAKYRPLVAIPRSLFARFLTLLALFSVSYLVLTLFPSYWKPDWDYFRPGQQSLIRGTCTPDAWSAGEWLPKPPPTSRTNFSNQDDAWEFLGIQGCASTREIFWHLAADNSQLYDRFPDVATWKWVPPHSCAIRDLDPEALVKDLVEEGGWFLIGDSVTENHFFSMSCLLYPHVRATPNYFTAEGFDRAWPQNLYLDPSSPLIKTINFPPGFSIENTPLVTFRRVDLLMQPEQLDALYHHLHPDSKYASANESLFSEEATWNIAPADYIKWFTAPLPEANYATMVVSTGGHWVTSLFSRLADGSMPHHGIQNIVDFFAEAMHAWAQEVQYLLDVARENELARGRGHTHRVPRRVLARAYLPGHEDCHQYRAPWTEWQPGPWGHYNWNQILDMDRKFEAVLESKKFPDVHFLAIERPALLRPDAHSAADCLHIMTGAGVLEGWTHYIWHYVTVELPSRIR